MTPPPETQPDEVLSLFTEEQLAGYVKRAALWLDSGAEGVRDLEDYLQRNTLLLMQITGDVATGKIKLPGSKGLDIWAKSVKDFPVLAERVLGILKERE